MLKWLLEEEVCLITLVLMIFELNQLREIGLLGIRAVRLMELALGLIHDKVIKMDHHFPALFLINF